MLPKHSVPERQLTQNQEDGQHEQPETEVSDDLHKTKHPERHAELVMFCGRLWTSRPRFHLRLVLAVHVGGSFGAPSVPPDN